MLSSFLFASLLLVMGLALVAWHWRSWRAAQLAELDAVSLRFAQRQFRRRTQASALIAALGLAIAGGEFVHSPWGSLGYWSGVLVLLIWTVTLALLDIVASHQHFGRQQAVHEAEAAVLRRQVELQTRHRKNGHPPERTA
jgi:hypothetical protein